jgi:hypothetical protein
MNWSNSPWPWLEPGVVGSVFPTDAFVFAGMRLAAVAVLGWWSACVLCAIP